MINCLALWRRHPGGVSRWVTVLLVVLIGSARTPADGEAPSTPEPDRQAVVSDSTPADGEGVITKAGRDLIDIRFTNESLANVINVFTRMLGINIIASPTDLQAKTVTVNLKGVEWKPTLNAILAMHGLVLLEKTPGSNVYSVARQAAEEPDPMIVETLYLSHKTVSEVQPLIDSLLAPKAKVLRLASANALVVRSTEANLAEIKQVIARIDIPGKQVCVEAKFMELDQEASKRLGIDWQMLRGLTLQGTDIGVQFGETRRKTSLDEAGTVRTVRDGASTVTDFDVTADNVSSVSVAADGTVTRASVLPLERTETRGAILSIDDFSVILSALNELDGVSLISSPKIIVMSGATNAFFSIGNRWPITKNTRTNRGTDESITDNILELDTGIKTDYIDGGYLRTGIELSVFPTAKTDDLIEVTIAPKLIRRIENTFESVPWPTLSVKEIETTFTLRNGQTVAIGGLTSTKDTKETSRIPFLGAIPILGRFFSHTYDAKEQVETIIFVTLSLAAPEALQREEGIPQDAELVHKKLIQTEARKKKFEADLKTAREKQ